MDPTLRHPGPRRARRPVPSLLVVALLAAAAWTGATAHAQRASVWLHADAASTAGAASTTLAVAAVRVGVVDLDGWLRFGVRLLGTTDSTTSTATPRRAAPTFGVGAAWRRSTTFGQLGNVTVEGGASLAALGGDPLLGGRVWVGTRGTIATVAISLAIEAGNDAPRAVDPSRPPPPDAVGQAALRAIDDQRERARLGRGDWDVGGRLGVAYRLDRSTILTVDASGRRLAGETAIGMALDLRSAGVADAIDARFGLRVEHLAGSTSGAVGAGVVHVPRRGPTSWVHGWLGIGPAGLRPGVEGRWVTRQAPGELAVQASWRPWLDPNAWGATLEYRHDLASAPGDVRFAVTVDGTASGGARVAASLRWERPW